MTDHGADEPDAALPAVAAAPTPTETPARSRPGWRQGFDADGNRVLFPMLIEPSAPGRDGPPPTRSVPDTSGARGVRLAEPDQSPSCGLIAAWLARTLDERVEQELGLGAAGMELLATPREQSERAPAPCWERQGLEVHVGGATYRCTVERIA